MQNVISVENVSKNYGDFRAVDQLSFRVHAGEIFALLGPNGSGKTTTIRMILDILKPDTGNIALFGSPITDGIKDRIGYLPEERGLYRKAKVLEVMAYLGTLKGMSPKTAEARSRELLEKLELGDNINSKVSELSKGMQQKVQFAVTVLHHPDLIIIDEPFSGLDPVNTRVVKSLIEEMKAEGVAIVMSTHQMAQVEAMADRMLMIHKGQQKLYGVVDTIRREHAQNAIIVEGQADWQALPGVISIEALNNGQRGTLLHLGPDTTPDVVLAAIAQSPDAYIERFERAIPSLDDVFIQVVEGAKA